MKYIKTYKIFEADGTFMYDPSWESVLPEYIKVIKGDPKNPERLSYKKSVSRHLGAEIQIPYETMDKNGGRENPDTLEFDIKQERFQIPLFLSLFFWMTFILWSNGYRGIFKRR